MLRAMAGARGKPTFAELYTPKLLTVLREAQRKGANVYLACQSVAGTPANGQAWAPADAGQRVGYRERARCGNIGLPAWSRR